MQVENEHKFVIERKNMPGARYAADVAAVKGGQNGIRQQMLLRWPEEEMQSPVRGGGMHVKAAQAHGPRGLYR